MMMMMMMLLYESFKLSGNTYTILFILVGGGVGVGAGERHLMLKIEKTCHQI